MKPAAILLCLASLLPWSVAALSAQEKPCGTEINPEQVDLEFQRAGEGAAPAVPPPVTQPYRVPLAIHIVRHSDGSGGFRPEQLAKAVQTLNQFWQPAGLQFLLYGSIDYIDNTYFFNIPDDPVRREELRLQRPVADAINVYFTHLRGWCGETTFSTVTTSQGILLDVDCADVDLDPSTFAHEMGHYFDLYHTHEIRFGRECPNGSNCRTAGDLLCDTPADPDLFERVDSACGYIDSATPPLECGPMPYRPLTNNFMSYAPARCRTAFTPLQIDKALTTLLSRRTNLFRHIKYVDPAAPAGGDGTPPRPFRTLNEALNAARDGDFIFMKSGSYPGALTISRPLTLGLWDTGSGAVIGQ